jgi:hypothetical protein
LASNVGSYVHRDSYKGRTTLQGWSAWLGVLITFAIIGANVVINPPHGASFGLGIGLGLCLAKLVYQDCERTRMSRWWAFWTFMFAAIVLPMYLLVRNSRGLRTASATA